MKDKIKLSIGVMIITVLAISAFGGRYYLDGWPGVVAMVIGMILAIPLVFLLHWLFDS